MWRRPPCEVVNWKTTLGETIGGIASRPPCEVVNWKVLLWEHRWRGRTSTSLWGRELKDDSPSTVIACISRPPCEVVNWKVSTSSPPCLPDHVDLLVRSWIESPRPLFHRNMLLSTSLWGRELKEVVGSYHLRAYESTSLWGRELKGFWRLPVLYPRLSTSLWGRELKVCIAENEESSDLVDLLVRSWIERKSIVVSLVTVIVDLLVRSWIERTFPPRQDGSVSCRPPCEVVNWKKPCACILRGRRSRPPCEVVNWK